LFGSPSLDFMYISASPPDAPPFSDTTIGWLISLFFWMAACIMRAIWSDAPPAPAATTISTGFVGSHANTGAPTSIIATAPAFILNVLIVSSSSVNGSVRVARPVCRRTLSPRSPRQRRRRQPDSVRTVNS